jgi:formylmethanofuran dehydrogenase subunit D
MRIEKGEEVSQQEVKEYLRLSAACKVTPEMINQTLKKGKTFKLSTVLEAILVYQLPS